MQVPYNVQQGAFQWLIARACAFARQGGASCRLAPWQLLVRVPALVLHQVAALCKRGLASRVVADVRPLARVRALVIHQVAVPCKCGPAPRVVTDVRSFSALCDGWWGRHCIHANSCLPYRKQLAVNARYQVLAREMMREPSQTHVMMREEPSQKLAQDNKIWGEWNPALSSRCRLVHTF